MTENYPVINNKDGSYLTAWSDGSLQVPVSPSCILGAVSAC